MIKRISTLFLASLLLVVGGAEVSIAAPVRSTGHSWQTTLDQNDRELTYSFDTDGGYGVAGYTSYSLDSLFVGVPGWQSIISQALGNWGTAAEITFTKVNDSGDDFDASSAEGILRFAAHSLEQEHKDAHAFLAMPTGYTEEDTGHSYWGDVHYNVDTTWDTNLLLAETLHNVGHSLGLIHNLDPDSVMFLWGGEETLTLSDHDLADLRAIYLPQKDLAPVLVAPVISGQRDWFAVADGTAELRGTVAVTASGSVVTTEEQKTGIKGVGASLADEDYGFDYVDLHLDAGGRIETAGANAYGIGAGDFNDINVSGFISTAGYSADGVALMGHDNILRTGATSLIRTSGAGGNGIFVGYEKDYSNTVVADGRIETSGNGGAGIYTAGFSDLTVNGGITTTGVFAPGIVSDNLGFNRIVVNQGAIIDTSGLGSDGISAFDHGNNEITMNGTITTVGDEAYGMYVVGDTNAVTMNGTLITSGGDANGVDAYGDNNAVTMNGTLTTSGDNAYGVYANGDNNAVTMNGTLTTSGDNVFGVYAYGDANRLKNQGSISSAGTFGYGLYLAGVYNQGINQGDIHTEGEFAHGMVARMGNNMLVHSGTIETSGEQAYGILIREGNNFLDLSGDVVSQQAEAVRIGGFFNQDDKVLEQTAETGNVLLLHGSPQISGDIVNDGADDGATVIFGIALDETAAPGYAVAATDFSYAGNFRGRKWLAEIFSGTIHLNGSRNEFSRLIVDSGATLGGNTTLAGDLDNNGRVAPGNSIGTIVVDGDYTQSAGALLEMEIGGSQSDYLAVGGDATFASGALLALKPLAPILGGDFSLLSVGGTVSGAPQLTLADSALLDFTLQGGNAGLSLHVDRTSYAAVAVAGQQPLGIALDSMLSTASGDLADVLLKIDGLSQVSEVQQTLTALVPTTYAALPDAAFSAIRSFSEALPGPERLAPSTTVGKDLQGYAVPLFSHSQRQNENGISDYSWDTGGFVAGLDRLYGKVLLGGALGFQRTEIDHDLSNSQSDPEMMFTALRAAVKQDQWHVKGVVGYGHQWDDSKRTIQSVAAGLNRQAESSDQGNSLFAGILGGYGLSAGVLGLTPFAGLDYASYRWGGFSEHGAGALNVEIQESTVESLRSTLGVVFTLPADFSNGFHLKSSLRLAWGHEFSDAFYEYQARMAGESFNVRGQNLGRDLLATGLTLQTVLGKGVSAMVGVTCERRQDDASYAGQVGFRYAF